MHLSNSAQCEVTTQLATSMPERHVVPFRVLDPLSAN